MSYEKEYRELFFMQQIYANLFSLTNKIQVFGDKCFEDLTMRQFMVLLAIVHMPQGEATINKVALKMGTTKQNANVMINSLEKKGLVGIEKSKRDKRAVNVSVTEAGMKALMDNGVRGNLALADIFDALGEQELETLHGLLNKLRRFDGHEDDGYEADATEFNNESPTEEQLELLAGFAEKRRVAKGNSANEMDRNTAESPL